MSCLQNVFQLGKGNIGCLSHAVQRRSRVEVSRAQSNMSVTMVSKIGKMEIESHRKSNNRREVHVETHVRKT